jgi:predicted nucleotidyltransferase
MERFICIRTVYGIIGAQIMSAVVPVRVSKELAAKITALVEADVFPNRSVLVREALRRLVVSEGIVAEKTTLGSIVARIAFIMIVWNEKAVTDVILFGSVARGEAAVESDVDLLVLVEDAEGWVVRQRLYDVVYPVILALGVDVSLIVVERKLFIRMVEDGDPFALSVLRDGVQLHGGFMDEYGEGAFGKGS